MGKALKLAGMDKLDFIKLLSSQKTSVYNYAPEELEEDIYNINRAAGSPHGADTGFQTIV